jgi:hypothetical protein
LLLHLVLLATSKETFYSMGIMRQSILLPAFPQYVSKTC